MEYQVDPWSTFAGIACRLVWDRRERTIKMQLIPGGWEHANQDQREAFKSRYPGYAKLMVERNPGYEFVLDGVPE